MKKLGVFSEEYTSQDLIKSCRWVVSRPRAAVAAFTRLPVASLQTWTSAAQTCWCHWGWAGWEPLSRLSTPVNPSYFQVLNSVAFLGAVRGFDSLDIFTHHLSFAFFFNIWKTSYFLLCFGVRFFLFVCLFFFHLYWV